MATLPVRPVVDSLGIAWARRDRYYFQGTFGAISVYVVTFNQRWRDSWDVLVLDGGPARPVKGEPAVAIVESLKAYLVGAGLEVPEARA